MAVNAAGALPFYSQLPTIDMLGLCDKHIAGITSRYGHGMPFAHRRADAPYVFLRRLGVIVFNGPLGNFFPRLPSDYELKDRNEFWFGYRPCEATIAGRPFRFFLLSEIAVWEGVREYTPEGIIKHNYPGSFQ